MYESGERANRRWAASTSDRPKPARQYNTGNRVRGDAGLLPGLHDSAGQFGNIVIGLTIGLVVKIVKFGAGGIAAPQHFHLQPGRYGLQLLRGDPPGEPVHFRPPGPERIRSFR